MRLLTLTVSGQLITTSLKRSLKSLKTGKAAGPDTINNRLLIELAQPLCDLFNFSLFSGKVPDIWKQANVTPIHKKNDPSDVSNYRPISLLSTVGKVIEKLVHKHVFNYFRDHEILTALQSGIVEGDSTINQLVDIYIILFVKHLTMEKK